MIKTSRDKIRITGEFDNWLHNNPKFIFQWDDLIQQYMVDIPLNNNIGNINNSVNNSKKVLQVKLLRNEVDWIIITKDKRFKIIKDSNGYMNNLVEIDEFKLTNNNSNIKINSGQCKSTTNNGCNNNVNLNSDGYDYINISSISELSSIEEIDLEDDLYLQEYNIDEVLGNPKITNEPFTILNYKSMTI